MPHVSIKPEVIFHFLNVGVTNSLLTSIIVLILFTIISLYYTANQNSDSKIIFFIRFIIGKLYDMFEPIMKDKTNATFSVLASFFLFILFSNWFGLLPGVGSIIINPPAHEETMNDALSEVGITIEEDAHAGKEEHHETAIPLLRGSTADLNTTIALALIAFALIQYFGFKVLGFDYISKFINLKGPIDFFTGILEIISELSKIISFAFRLFGNIFAGEVLLVVVAFLVPVLASFPFLLLEVFVGFIQALVFSMLTAVFISVAIAKH